MSTQGRRVTRAISLQGPAIHTILIISHLKGSCFFFFLLFKFKYISFKVLQCFVGFCHTTTQISSIYTHILSLLASLPSPHSILWTQSGGEGGRMEKGASTHTHRPERDGQLAKGRLLTKVMCSCLST